MSSGHAPLFATTWRISSPGKGISLAALKALEESSTMSLGVGDLEMAMTAQCENANILRYQGKLKESMRCI